MAIVLLDQNNNVLGAKLVIIEKNAKNSWSFFDFTGSIIGNLCIFAPEKLVDGRNVVSCLLQCQQITGATPVANSLKNTGRWPQRVASRHKGEIIVGSTPTASQKRAISVALLFY